MNIAIAGGSGYVGSALTGYLEQMGHHIYILTRNSKNKKNSENITFIEWMNPGSKPEYELPPVDAFINLAGASLAQRWTEKNKENILNSRIDSTREVIRIFKASSHKPEVLVSASAVAYYGISDEEEFTEESPKGESNFLQEVSVRWENEADKAEDLGIRVVKARMGLVLQEFIPPLVSVYKMFGGGTFGSGIQWFSWIHLRDAVEMLLFAATTKEIKGALNITAPAPAQMETLGREIAKVTGRPHWLSVPSFVIEKMLGEMSVMILGGQKVIPQKSLGHGFSFHFPTLQPALINILKE